MARTEDYWQPRNGGTYIETISPVGYDILINGTNKYLNFNTISGSSGYGFRDNGGTMEFKNSGGAWASLGSGGGGGTWGSITGTLSAQTDLQTALDLKVPYTGATANLNLGTFSLISHSILGDATDGIILESANGTDIGILGAGNNANVVWAGNHNFTLATQDTIAAFTGAGKTLGSLALATYPSLTELSYVKGVTSAIQTQISGLVPYTGATTDLNLGTHALTTTGLGTFGTLTTNGDLSVNATGSSEATPRVFGITNMASGNAVQFQFGDNHNGFQNAYAKDTTIYAYWGIVLCGGMQNYNSGFTPPAFTKTTNTGVLIVSSNDIGDDPGAGATNIVTLGIQAVAAQTNNLTEWRNSAGGVLASMGSTGTFTAANISGTNTGDQTIIQTPGFTIDGAGSAITTGKVKGFFTAPYSGTITGWSIVVDAGTATVKVWKIASGTAKPTAANSINTSGVAISSGTAVRSSTVTDFTSTAVTAGDIFAYNIEAVATATELTFELEITE
jgi:hypothetical protein